MICGIPTEAGAFSFTVRASNSYGKADQTYTLTISADIPEILFDTLSNGTCGQSYSDAIMCSYKLPVTWDVCSGSLPGGLYLNEDTGIISGVPNEAGTYTFGIRVSNRYGGSARKEIIMTVAGAAPKISTGTLPNGKVGERYSAQIIVENGKRALLNYLYGYDLPDGLRISGKNGIYTVSGIPTKAGSFVLGISVSNDYGTDEIKYTIKIDRKSEDIKDKAPKISKTKIKLLTGASYTLKMKNTKTTPVWKSSNKNVVKVKNGKVTGLRAGTANIVAVVDGKKYYCEVKVPAPRIKKRTLTMKKGKTIYVGLNNTKIKKNSIKWHSSNTKVVKVGANGKIRGISKGKATIYTNAGGVYNSCTVIVK